MLRNLLGMLTLLCLFTMQSSAADEKKAEKSDKDKLQGTWVIVSIEFMGQKIETPKGKENSLTIKGDKAIMKDSDKPKEQEGSFKIDDKKKVKEIDLTGPKDDKPTELETLKGIYVIEGDTLKIATSPKGPMGDRPAGFDAKDIMVLVFKKKK